MPFYERGNARIHYEVAGSGFPLFIIHGGGLNSKANYANVPFDTVAEFKDRYKVITFDLRNANGGESTGPLEVDDPWGMHTDDQIGLLDHLGIDKFLVMGFCIGNPLAWNLIQRAPGRVVASVHAQPSGADPKRPGHFVKTNSSGWAPKLLASRPDLDQATVDKFLQRMYGNVDFVMTATRDFVRNHQAPVLVLPDDTDSHPYETAMEMARLAPNAQLSLYPWKDNKQNVAFALRHIHTFLRANTPR